MLRRGILGTTLLVAAFTIGGIAGACSGGDEKNKGDADLLHGDGGVIFWDAGSTGVTLTPTEVSVTVNPGGAPPAPTQFTLTGLKGDERVIWRSTNPALGTVDQNGLFTPGGDVGGEGYVEVIVGSAGFRAHVVVTVAHVQNGGAEATGADPGAGGLGGVGGEGEGGEVADDLVGALTGKPAADAKLTLLYPYDKTVFPLDILPPLLQWSTGGHGNFEAVYVHLSAPPYYDYKGYFGRPSNLAAAADFVRHPIPRSVWSSATKSAQGGTLTAEIVLAAGGKAYGPIRATWDIALAPFSGTVYYQAYATAFAANEPELTNWGERFGGATLSIRVGDEAPKKVAGEDSDDKTGCRVCHSVSAYGDRMIAQHGGEYADTSSYDLKNGNQEQPIPYGRGTVGWAGLYPDGSLGLANSIDLTGSNSNDGDTALYDMETGTKLTSPGLAEFATRIGLPAFSPDGKKASFTLFEGKSTNAVGTAAQHPLVVMDFELANRRFSNPTLLWKPPGDDQKPSFVTFMPTSDAAVFQRRWQGTNDDQLSTWYGSHGELWWVDLATQTAKPLEKLNGVGYLPKGPNEHDDDARLNYEPSISPVASGGYAWIVFMSRRMYGNVATSGPWHSDPRDYDTHTPCTAERTDNCYTTKKLWMAAIDLNPAPGTDPSHPAFYIPGQEIRGTNSRPFFALQPCLSDRGTCSTGIDCCSGFCRDGYCVAPPEYACSEIDEKCETTADCCDSRADCINKFCAIILR